MVGAVSNGYLTNRMSFARTTSFANSKAAEEANESVSEKIAEASNQRQPSSNIQIKSATPNPASNAPGKIIDMHI